MPTIPRKLLLTFILMALSGLFLFGREYQTLGDGKLHFHMFDISLGDALFLKTPHGRTVFIDGGVNDEVVSKVSALLPFWKRKIDFLIITHPDLDHLAGGFEVLKRYEVGRVLLTGAVSTSQTFQKFLEEIDRRKIPLTFVDADADFQFDGVAFDTVFPSTTIAGRKFSKINNSSIVQRVSFGENSLLLTGDIEKATEAELLAFPFGLKSDILKVAHHGSRSSSTEPFLKAVQASTALISAAEKNRFGHPHPEVMDLLSELIPAIFLTRDQGDIEVILTGDVMSVIPAKKG